MSNSQRPYQITRERISPTNVRITLHELRSLNREDDEVQERFWAGSLVGPPELVDHVAEVLVNHGLAERVEGDWNASHKD